MSLMTGRTFVHRYEVFNNSLETFLRSSEINRLECAEVLTIDFQNMNRTILDRIYGDVDDVSSASGQSQWAKSMSWSSASAAPISPKSALRYQTSNTPPIDQSRRYVTSSIDSPYSSPVYSYSCPSSVGRLTYARHLEGITVSLDALYFLLQAAQDLTDLSPIDIHAQRLDVLQLNPRSLKLSELPMHLSSTINAVIGNLLQYDRKLIRRLMDQTVEYVQLEELVGWISEDGERPFWALGECFEELRRVREWRRAKGRRWWGIIWDWIVS